ncbi:phosphopentomutase [Oceanirhabdus sp. W0125-5]|uniref:phosphopentomutase n=1 Tax=Oceanirhabdus sp. W0125-5 TaxID=2999116 RepID=UPI0022F2F5CC|nr:phosphopentomutase [Oceanirhabdus sp. W0125-5]WBW95308.1 phosphopentomutase [Oceanirhabdus sp. W0125-5]
MSKRAIIIVLDSVGIGALPDADLYGDKGSNTVGNISEKLGGLKLKNMEALGLGNIDEIKGIDSVDTPKGAFGRCSEASKGKDTITGHWEISGVILEEPLNTYPNGFSEDIIKDFEEKIGRKIIGNKVASGTEIIKELGEEHVKTGYPIVYTSADSVFQIAAHEEVISVPELYNMCQIARDMLVGERSVGRVIARPFVGEVGNFTRTANRRDYALNPPIKMLLQYMEEAGQSVMAVGKIEDIFNKLGVTDAVHTKNNMDGVDNVIEYMKMNKDGLIFANLVDFDMHYGHRNNVEGYAQALLDFDNRMPEILENMDEDDVLIITADHGCDPTMPGTDHSREYVPLLVYGNNIKENVNLGTRKSFCDIGKTVLDMFNVDNDINGESFYTEIKK